MRLFIRLMAHWAMAARPTIAPICTSIEKTNPSTRFVNSLVYTGVGIVGALSVVGGGLSVGQLTCFLSYANQYTKPFNEISGVVTELQNALVISRMSVPSTRMAPAFTS